MPVISRAVAQSMKPTPARLITSRPGRASMTCANRLDSSGRASVSSSPLITTVAVPAAMVTSTMGGACPPSPVMPAATDAAADRAQQGQNEADDQDDNADRPEDRDLGDKADDQEDEPKADHEILRPAVTRHEVSRLPSGGARQEYPARRGNEHRRAVGRGI